MSYKLYIGSKFSTSILSRVIYFLLALANTIIINRYLGVELRGDYAFYLNIINISSLILGFALSSSYPYFIRKNHVNSFYVIFKIVNIQLIIYLFLAAVIHYFFANNYPTQYLFLIVLMQYVNQLDFMAISDNITKRNLYLTLSNAIYTLTLFYIFSSFPPFVDYVFLALAVFTFVKIYYYLVKFNWHILVFKSFASDIALKKVLTMGFFPMAISLVGLLNYSLDIFVVKYYMTSYDVGMYSVAFTLATVFWFIPDAIKEFLINISKQDSFLFVTLLSIRISILIFTILTIFFMIYGDVLVVTLYGSEYLPSFLIFLVLFVGTLPLVFYKIINSFYLVKGEQKFSLNLLIIATLINLFMNIALVPIMGTFGAAISSTISYYFLGIMFFYRFKKDFNVNYSSIFNLKIKELFEIFKQ